MEFLRDRTAGGGARRAPRMLGLAAILAAAAFGGSMEGIARFSPPERPSELAVAAATDVERIVAPDAAAPAAPVWDLPNLDHPRVDYWVRRFSTDKRDEFEKFLTRSGKYVPMISEKLAERDMPQDLIYLAMIESGFNPKAYSHAHASGLWQFISETGRRYGLDINRAVDERNDPVKATEAALDYLTYLYNRFDSWYLAAAGYNSGENRVGRIMRQVTGSERGDEYSYYQIWNRLPRETRDYVPLMVAAARIAKEPEKYGFGDVEYLDAMAYEEVVVPPATPLPVIAEASGTSVADLRELNPHFKLDRTRNDMASPVRIPSGSSGTFASNFASVRNNPTYAAAPTRTYRVRRGDNLTVIARRHGVTITQIRRANNLRSDRIRAGAVLTIPT